MNFPESTDLILVGVVPNKRDLDVARLLGWYRIPLRSALKLIDVDFIAFYQTSNFGETERWQISCLAEMRGHELVRRIDLFRDQPDHPHAMEEYHKVSLGPLIPLSKPIRAEGWKRLTFLYTTGAHFASVATLNDLVIRNEERTILWRTLRERAAAGKQYREEPGFSLSLDEQMQFFVGGFREADGGYLAEND